MGSTVKILLRFTEPFWRTHNLCGTALSNTGPLTAIMDNTSPKGVPVLVGFVVGALARTWHALSAATKLEAVMGQLVRLYGPEVRKYYVDWHETGTCSLFVVLEARGNARGGGGCCGYGRVERTADSPLVWRGAVW